MTIAKLLVVDDEAPQMRALCETLSVEGYQTTGFSSPRQALAELGVQPFDLLLTDLMMSEMDGIALIDAARRINPDIAAIVMTGHGAIDTAVRAMQLGAFDYILKPFKLNVLLPVISRALEVRRLQRENTALLERERQQSQELANAYRDLESFSYSISHDLRSPLRTIEGFARILEEDSAVLSAEARRHLNFISDGCRKMNDLIVGLLEFSRASRSVLKMTRIDMRALAIDAAAEARGAHTGPVPIIDISELPAIEGDPTVMRQVWLNLIANALKYSSKRPDPKVSIAGRLEGGEALFQVQDNGVGFNMRYTDKLFGVFQRLHRETEFQGTGVGLSIVQRILVRHRGRIWAEAEEDRGACFHFAVPAIGGTVPGGRS